MRAKLLALAVVLILISGAGYLYYRYSHHVPTDFAALANTAVNQTQVSREAAADAAKAEALEQTVDGLPPASSPPDAQAQPVAAGHTFSVPILMYHHINDYRNKNDQLTTNLSVSPKNFAKQLDYLAANGYTSINFAQLQRGTNLPPKPVIITFDDGYTDATTSAMPILKNHSMNGVFYIISGLVGKPGYMDWKQINSLVDGGMELGGHTVSHLDLSQLSEASQHREIFQDIADINQQTGVTVRTFAYPAGRYNDTTLRLIRQAGTVYGLTTEAGTATSKNNPLRLPRLRVFDQTNLKQLLGQ